MEEAGYSFSRPDLGSKPLRESNGNIDLSLIVPVYNAEDYLERCIQSLMDQKTEFKYEVICINDGSKDKSLEILESFREKYPDIIKIIDQSNHGIAYARNVGLENSTGKYVGFADNDDFVSDSYVQTLMSEAISNNADVVQVGFDSYNKFGKQSSKSKPYSIIFSSDKMGIYSSVSGYIWSGIYRRSIFENIRFPQNFWYEDMITRLLIARYAKKIVISSEVLYHKFFHGKNASNVIWNKGNIKSLDQVWLPKILVDWSFDILGLKPDLLLDCILLNEWGRLLYVRTLQLPYKQRKAAFMLAACYFNSIKSNSSGIMLNLKRVEKSFLDYNFLAWRGISMYNHFKQ